MEATPYTLANGETILVIGEKEPEGCMALRPYTGDAASLYWYFCNEPVAPGSLFCAEHLTRQNNGHLQRD